MDYSSFRLLSLSSNLDKIIEKLMHERIITFLNDNNVVYKKQLVFKKIILVRMRSSARLKILKNLVIKNNLRLVL